MEKGLVFDIHRGTTHDGPGMRTTVFLKGCPLALQVVPESGKYQSGQGAAVGCKKCIGCMSCAAHCTGKCAGRGGRRDTDRQNSLQTMFHLC